MAEWWETEPQLLSDALSALAQWERADATAISSSSSSTSGDISSATSSDTASTMSYCSSNNGDTMADEDDGEEDSRAQGWAARAVGPMKNRSRERKQQEMAALRDEIWRLEGKLSDLRLGKSLLSDSAYDGSSTTITTGTGTSKETNEIAVWESMARGQLRSRNNAEKLNVELKQMVYQQAQVANELVALIRRAEQARKYGFRMPGASSSFTVQIPQGLHDRVPTASQWSRLEMLSLHWREAFALCDKFQDPSKPRFMDAHVLQIDENGGQVDLYASSVVPFPVLHVEQALWSHYLEPHAEGSDQSFTQNYEASDDRIASEFCVRGPYGRVYGKCVKRWQYTEHGDPLFVTHSHVEPQRPCDPRFDVAMFQDSWVRLVDGNAQSPTSSLSSSSPCTLIQHVRRARLEFARDEAPPHASTANGLARFVLHVLETEVKWAQQSVENTLMRPRHTISS